MQVVGVASKVKEQILEHSGSLLIPFLGSIFLALLSQFAVQLPFSPIPISLQTVGIFILAGTLGSKRALQSVILYILEGTCGLPVFAGGLANPLWMISPKAGYVAGFAIAAYVTGKMLELKDHWSIPHIALSLLVGQVVIYTTGVGVLSLFLGINTAITVGWIPFIPGACMKLIATTFFLKGYNSCR